MSNCPPLSISLARVSSTTALDSASSCQRQGFNALVWIGLQQSDLSNHFSTGVTNSCSAASRALVQRRKSSRAALQRENMMNVRMARGKTTSLTRYNKSDTLSSTTTGSRPNPNNKKHAAQICSECIDIDP
ncbi:LOW QUALITY PROTEIN: hypothetical protein PanWU01x14_135820 [Parasponia andersonii]|uniref:Uncharacterized protein n=1 Tax=Parasponia andersonii TaxID=3476 RepID=A0A2P5CPE9_PARAD|nr:LOW QUALITY PROTEIN: hypothetical protein PanWU01x14_135820 [Parasponia andersonii]